MQLLSLTTGLALLQLLSTATSTDLSLTPGYAGVEGLQLRRRTLLGRFSRAAAAKQGPAIRSYAEPFPWYEAQMKGFSPASAFNSFMFKTLKKAQINFDSDYQQSVVEKGVTILDEEQLRLKFEEFLTKWIGDNRDAVPELRVDQPLKVSCGRGRSFNAYLWRGLHDGQGSAPAGGWHKDAMSRDFYANSFSGKQSLAEHKILRNFNVWMSFYDKKVTDAANARQLHGSSWTPNEKIMAFAAEWVNKETLWLESHLGGVSTYEHSYIRVLEALIEYKRYKEGNEEILAEGQERFEKLRNTASKILNNIRDEYPGYKRVNDRYHFQVSDRYQYDRYHFQVNMEKYEKYFADPENWVIGSHVRRLKSNENMREYLVLDELLALDLKAELDAANRLNNLGREGELTATAAGGYANTGEDVGVKKDDHYVRVYDKSNEVSDNESSQTNVLIFDPVDVFHKSANGLVNGLVQGEPGYISAPGTSTAEMRCTVWA